MPIKETTAEYDPDNRLKMSYEEFLDWADEDTHAEWVDGEVIVFTPVKEIHQITLQLSTFGEMANLPANVIDQFKQQIRAALKKNREAKSDI